MAIQLVCAIIHPSAFISLSNSSLEQHGVGIEAQRADALCTPFLLDTTTGVLSERKQNKQLGAYEADAAISASLLVSLFVKASFVAV